MNKDPQLVEKIDACLPQTQCGLCHYSGCKPYAEAIVNQNEAIDHCLPGGVSTLIELAALTQQNPEPYIEEMQLKSKPALTAMVREDICIGCTKCIAVCPVDAIIGAAKLMHTIIQDTCTGCELCVPACPVDCIDIIQIALPTPIEKKQKAHQSRERFLKRNERLLTQKEKAEKAHQLARLLQNQTQQTKDARQIAITEAIARAKIKKTSVQDIPADVKKSMRLTSSP